MSRAHASDELRALVESRIRDVPDFPTPGILFKDIGPLLADPEAFAAIVADGARRHTGRVRRSRCPTTWSTARHASPCRRAP